MTVTVQSEIRKLDAVLPEGTVVDVVKIDVEGHELQVLRGMARTIAGSPAMVILLEKLMPQAGYEAAIAEFLAAFGMEIYSVGPHSNLERLTLPEFEGFSGNVLAVRPAARGDLDRTSFSLYPQQLWMVGRAAPDGALSAGVSPVLFHGPYWFLERGLWNIRFEGKISGRVEISIAERQGHAVLHFTLDETCRDQTFYVDHDLVQFECIALAAKGPCITLERFVFTKTNSKKFFRDFTRQGWKAFQSHH